MAVMRAQSELRRSQRLAGGSKRTRFSALRQIGSAEPDRVVRAILAERHEAKAREILTLAAQT
jgi:hypothetical protein